MKHSEYNANLYLQQQKRRQQAQLAPQGNDIEWENVGHGVVIGVVAGAWIWLIAAAVAGQFV